MSCPGQAKPRWEGSFWVLFRTTDVPEGDPSSLVPGHPKSKDLIKDFTVASDSGGVGEVRLTGIPGQRLVESASGESISSVIGLQKEGTKRAICQFHPQNGQ